MKYLMLTESCFDTKILVPADRLIVREVHFDTGHHGHKREVGAYVYIVGNGEEPYEVAESFDAITEMLREAGK